MLLLIHRSNIKEVQRHAAMLLLFARFWCLLEDYMKITPMWLLWTLCIGNILLHKFLRLSPLWHVLFCLCWNMLRSLAYIHTCLLPHHIQGGTGPGGCDAGHWRDVLFPFDAHSSSFHCHCWFINIVSWVDNRALAANCLIFLICALVLILGGDSLMYSCALRH